MKSPLPAVALLVALLFAAGAAAGPTVLTPTSAGTVVTGTVRLAKGAWRLADEADTGVLRITEDGTTLYLEGAALLGSADDTPPDERRGIGIVIEGAKNVTIRGGVIRGFRVAIRAVRAPGLVISGVDASENFRPHLGAPSATSPKTSAKTGPRTEPSGAGFSLTDCTNATVRDCQVHAGQNGLLLTRCTRSAAYGNDFSFNSGWGIALDRSQRCKVTHNHCDGCVRSTAPRAGGRASGAAGILVVGPSAGHLIVGNSATHGGNGLRLGAEGCDRHLVFDNDVSHAIGAGIALAAGTENVFVRNTCNDCGIGIRIDQGSANLIAGNRIHGGTTAGILIERGRANRLVHNDISEGRVGVRLGTERESSSSKNVLLGNDIVGPDVAVRLIGDHGSVLRWNELYGRSTCLILDVDTRLDACERNLFRGSRLASRPPSLAVQNATGTPWTLPLDNSRRGRLRGAPPVDPATLPETLTLVRPAPRLPATPPTSDGRTAPARLARDMPRGRGKIRIGPWGPLDPRDARVPPK